MFIETPVYKIKVLSVVCKNFKTFPSPGFNLFFSKQNYSIVVDFRKREEMGNLWKNDFFSSLWNIKNYAYNCYSLYLSWRVIISIKKKIITQGKALKLLFHASLYISHNLWEISIESWLTRRNWMYETPINSWDISIPDIEVSPPLEPVSLSLVRSSPYPAYSARTGTVPKQFKKLNYCLHIFWLYRLHTNTQTDKLNL